jgi:hypothetical protein
MDSNKSEAVFDTADLPIWASDTRCGDELLSLVRDGIELGQEAGDMKHPTIQIVWVDVCCLLFIGSKESVIKRIKGEE